MAAFGRYRDLGVTLEDHVALVEIRRPPHNFFDHALIGALADALRVRLQEAERRLGQPNMTRGNVLAELRSRHREARRGRRDRDLSELTLAIIRIKAEELDAAGAVEAIDRFLECWPPAGAPPEPGRPEP